MGDSEDHDRGFGGEGLVPEPREQQGLSQEVAAGGTEQDREEEDGRAAIGATAIPRVSKQEREKHELTHTHTHTI